MKITRLLISIAALAVVLPAHAQDRKPVQGYVGAGYVLPEGKANDVLQNGWNISGGVIFRPVHDSPFGIRADLGFTELGANDRAVKGGSNAGYRVDDGYMRMWNLTGEALWEFGDPHHIGGYVGAGLGVYRRDTALTAEVTSLGTICDPWYGCYTAAFTGDQDIVDDTLTKLGYSAVAGMTFAVGNGEIYVEARYHWQDSSPTTQFLPIIVGFRF